MNRDSSDLLNTLNYASSNTKSFQLQLGFYLIRGFWIEIHNSSPSYGVLYDMLRNSEPYPMCSKMQACSFVLEEFSWKHLRGCLRSLNTRCAMAWTKHDDSPPSLLSGLFGYARNVALTLNERFHEPRACFLFWTLFLCNCREQLSWDP